MWLIAFRIRQVDNTKGGPIRRNSALHACAHHGALSPQVDNTNVDRSVATLHTTVLRCLARTAAGERLFDPVRPTQRLSAPYTAPSYAQHSASYAHHSAFLRPRWRPQRVRMHRPCMHTLTTARLPSSPQVRQQIVVMNEVFESHNRATWSSKAMLQVHATDRP